MNGLMCGPPLLCGGSAHALTAHPAGTYALWRRACYVPTTAKKHSYSAEKDDTRGSKTTDPFAGQLSRLWQIHITEDKQNMLRH